AKNKPARDFLENVGAAFRQALNGGYLFLFPASIAAMVGFEPPSTDAASAAPLELAPARSAVGTALRPRRPFTRYRELALENCDIPRIHHVIEANAVLHSVSQNGYVPP